MRFASFIRLLSLLITFLCTGCSQQLVLSHREFVDEVRKVKAGSKLSVRNRLGQEHTGTLLIAAYMLPDSSHVVILENTRGGQRVEFKISPLSTTNEVMEIRMPRRTPSVFAGAGIGMFSGAVLGIAIGSIIYTGDDEGDQQGRALATFFGGIGGAVIGCVSGAMIAGAHPAERVLILKSERGTP